jgi:hypothetical protein
VFNRFNEISISKVETISRSHLLEQVRCCGRRFISPIQSYKDRRCCINLIEKASDEPLGLAINLKQDNAVVIRIDCAWKNNLNMYFLINTHEVQKRARIANLLCNRKFTSICSAFCENFPGMRSCWKQEE